MSNQQDDTPNGEKTNLFTVSVPEFNESSYWGRFNAFRAVANPLHAFYSNEKIRGFQALINAQQEAEATSLKETGELRVHRSQDQIRQLRIAQTVVSTAIHPDTGELLPWTQRFSSFLPVNIPIAYLLIMAPPTPLNTLVGQWINQTYNAWLNYGNRNASSVYTTEDIVKSYSAACTSSIVVSLSIRHALRGVAARLAGPQLILLNSFSAFLACASAGFLNAWFMRRTELEKGIEIFDPQNSAEPVGKSTVCAQKAVYQTAFSRILLNVTIFLPSLTLMGIQKMHLMPKNKYAVEVLNLSMLLGELYMAVPVGVAMFPQRGSILASELEKEF